MKTLVIDRFEGEYAVCESSEQEYCLLERSQLPSDAVEGSVVIVTEEGVFLDPEETEARRRRIAEKQRRLFEE